MGKTGEGGAEPEGVDLKGFPLGESLNFLKNRHERLAREKHSNLFLLSDN
jgi:hypothetical protein